MSRRPCFRAWAVGKLSLWVASPGVLSQLPFSTDRSLGLLVALSQRGTASDTILDKDGTY